MAYEGPRNEDPQLIHDVFNILRTLLAAYGWHILFVVVAVVVVWEKFLRHRVNNWQSMRELNSLDPSLVAERFESMENARLRQMEKYNERLEQLKREQLEREKAKKKEIEQLEQTGARARNDSDRFRGGYYPLSGSGASSSYRPPPKRKPCGGGCG